jgi:hypothetical protein
MAFVLLGCAIGTCATGTCGLTGGAASVAAASVAVASVAVAGQRARVAVETPAPLVTDVPTTTAPVSTAPVSTGPGSTGPGSTGPVTPAQTTPATVPPTEPTIEPETPQSSSPATSTSSSALLWILIALGAIALIAIIAVLANLYSRRTDETAAWRSRRSGAYAEGAALHDAIASAEAQFAGRAAGQLGGLAAADEAARWADIQRRADDFTQRLYQLRETAPDEDGRARVEDVLGSLHALRSAVDAERSSGVPAGLTADITRDRLRDFRAALHALRADY